MHSRKKPSSIVHNKTYISANISSIAYRNCIPPEDMQALSAVSMPIKEVHLLSEREQTKFILYYARQASFNSFDDTFLAQLQTIPNRHCKAFNIVGTILYSLNLWGVHTIIKKNWRFYLYISKYTQEKVLQGTKKLNCNSALRMQAFNITSQQFKLFLFVTIDKKH